MAEDVTASNGNPAFSGLVMVTGATGFVGSALILRLAQAGVRTRACFRRDGVSMPEGVEKAQVPGLSEDENWTQALAGVVVVVHTAARVHVMIEQAGDPLAEFRRTNVRGTLHLARQAAAAGVRRFVFISSIKVNGEATVVGKPFTAEDAPAPLDAYGISKMEAEQGLLQIAAQTGMEVVMIRPPLVYGPGVKANFAALVRAAKRGWPLPLASVDNKRSLVSLDNLVDLVLVAIAHPRAANQVFLVSDGEDLSTPELINKIAEAMGRRAYLLPMPVWALWIGATLVNRKGVMQRLCGSLQIDISKAKDLLGWTPPGSVEEGLRRVVSTP